MGTPRVVIIGSGFGGLFAAQAMKRHDVSITLIGETSHHLFQPLLYQVATGILSEGEIAPSTREILTKQANARVILGTATEIDLAQRQVTSVALDDPVVTPYDYLIVAAGAGQSYFGNDQFAEFAPGMKSIDDALELRSRIFTAFELAEIAGSLEEQRQLLTFVVVGAGPTGVEMAGQIAELAHRTLPREFRSIDPRAAHVILVDGAPQVLPAFGNHLGDKAQAHLEKIGVEVRLGLMVTDVDAVSVTLRDKDGHEQRIEAITKIWAAGVAGNPLGKQLAAQSDVELDRAGRVLVEPDLTIPGHPNVFVVGDLASLKGYPGVAQVAIQGARYAAKVIQARETSKPAPPEFEYHDKGSMATISRFSAVASIGRFKVAGFLAWLLWCFIHILYIVGFKSRFTTLFHWTISFLGSGRSERTVTRQQALARLAMKQVGEGGVAPSLGTGGQATSKALPKAPASD